MPGLKVVVEEGELQGCVRTTSEGVEYNAYLGIPYAKPPVGPLRFKDPQSPEKWEGLRDATKHGNCCTQENMQSPDKHIIGSEDCLYLNVYVSPVASKKEKLPVMVWIHGGGFWSGTGDSDFYGPDHLVQKDIVLVSINYRVGPLGFLCLHTPEIPGNAGLKDMIFALRWLQRNVENFGGDPCNVTIFGESAGSAAVHYLMLSKMSKSLFSKAIMQSGTSISVWAHQNDPEQNCFDLAKKLGMETTDKDEVLEFLSNVPADKLVKIASKRMGFVNNYEFLPVVENMYLGIDSFITVAPLRIMETGDYYPVPCIFGFNSKEGLVYLSEHSFDAPKLDREDDVMRYSETAAKTLLRKSVIDENIIQQVKEFYFPKNKILFDCFADLIGDGFFKIDTITSAKLMSQHCKLYLYHFAYDGEMNVLKSWMPFKYSGANHADDLGYLFSMPFVTTVNESDAKMLRRMTSMWTNFAKFGNPVPKVSDVLTEIWKPYDADETNCLNIEEDLTLISNICDDKIEFWKSLSN